MKRREPFFKKSHRPLVRRGRAGRSIWRSSTPCTTRRASSATSRRRSPRSSRAASWRSTTTPTRGGRTSAGWSTPTSAAAGGRGSPRLTSSAPSRPDRVRQTGKAAVPTGSDRGSRSERRTAKELPAAEFDGSIVETQRRVVLTVSDRSGQKVLHAFVVPVRAGGREAVTRRGPPLTPDRRRAGATGGLSPGSRAPPGVACPRGSRAPSP